MKKSINKLIGLVIGIILLTPSLASAANEQAIVDLAVTPSSTLYKEAFRPANIEIGTLINTDEPAVLPMKKAVLNLGPNLTFNPNNTKTPVCPDNKIGPAAGIGMPIELLIARCPLSIIGNGTALFQLGQNNTPEAQLQGLMLVFNGGYKNGLPRIKVMAYSYDTSAGVYTEGLLNKAGKISFIIPRLSYDSSVTSLNLNIPGKNENIYLPSQEKTVFLPAGKDKDYSRARCPGSSFGLSGVFDLGKRNSAEEPEGDTLVVSDSVTIPCAGLVGRPKVAAPKIAGPSKVKRNKVTRFKVTVKNNGTATAKNVRLTVSGKGVSLRQLIGNLAPAASKTVTVKLRFKKAGKIKAVFSSGPKSRKTVIVR
jgi:hypothetical protein